MNEEFTDAQHTQFVLSYELLCLFRWLAEHDIDKLKKIIGAAIASGLHEDIKRVRGTQNHLALEEMQGGIIDFFGLLESLLLDAIKDSVTQQARQKKLMPAIDQIDSTICDDETVQFSLEKAMAKDGASTEQTKEVLFKELLKRWKPHKKNLFN